MIDTNILVSGDKDFHTPEVKKVIKTLYTREAVELLS